ncbi:DJ-1/PfpI family protein [Microbacterium sp. Au-Mic1]|uniref:DJ-1/PfpI family protein n=1 Tax=Microbacterium sp. Au-Mic1 TaxID=2906457 RepID=UPI001E5283C7|nr:DJ-1/PfpI family protein [Microbacterium sp. Au-Mic1]MCE4027183.1 DJ-1/PfpI family protein [Microbacterium sp. Au-Mic1]
MHTVLRRALLTVSGLVLGAATLAGIAAAGFATTMAHDFSALEPPHPPTAASTTKTAQGDRIKVAVLLGRHGTVATDAMGPYGVFAASERFDVRTVSSSRAPVALSGGLTVVPDAAYEDYASGRLTLPDLVVVPAISDPAATEEADLRAFIETAHASDRTVMGVCAGARVLVETAVLDGRRATSFWSDLDDMRATHPETTWISGQRWVEDGNVLTTAGVSSGIAASLHVVQRLAGTAEAVRIADDVRYPHWQPEGGTDIPVNTVSPADYPYVLGATLPWGQPRYGLGLTPGVDEIDVAAAAELYGGAAFTAHVIPVAETGEVTTRHGMTLLATPITDAGPIDRLVIPGVTSSQLTQAAPGVPVFVPAATANGGNTSFDPVLADIARTEGRSVATTAAKYIEYPLPALPAGGGFPTRISVLAILALLVSAAVGLLPVAIGRMRRRQAGRARTVTDDGDLASTP